MDYTFVPQTVTFDGMLSVMCFDVDTTQDFIYETDEFFSLVLSTDDPTLSLSPSEANLTIIDNDDGMCTTTVKEIDTSSFTSF